jgi:cytochrome b-561
MISAFLLTVIGLKAVFDSHNLKTTDGKPTPIANLYSLHSWMGIITVILFAMQWLGGFITFLFPGLASHLRASYMPIHTSFGIMIFVLACGTSLLGITEKLIFALKTYSKRDPEGVMANWIGVLIIVFGVLVVYLATNYKYKRLPRPEDEMLLNETHNNME